jgi:hypothetical protein
MPQVLISYDEIERLKTNRYKGGNYIDKAPHTPEADTNGTTGEHAITSP